jgi:RimJ/RimL family protein N-acetyltransferase
MADAEMLLAWRNDPVTRQFSLTTEVIALADHMRWLERVLINPERQLYIAVVDGRPVGSLRADHQDGRVELSWTIAPDERGHGYGKAMLQMAVGLYRGCHLTAVIKPENVASRKMAAAAGFQHHGQGPVGELWHQVAV